MQPIVFYTQMFVDSSKQDMEDSKEKLLYLLEALVSCNQVYLRSHPDTPSIYKANCFYQPEFNTEEWQDIPTTLERGFGDCEDLAAWRCAELRTRYKIRARPHIRWRMVGGSWRFHAVVKWPDRFVDGKKIKGRVEDPSRRLGMMKWSGYLSVSVDDSQF